MTEQEEQQLAARLKRIWEPEEASFHVARFGKFSFKGRWASGLYVHIELEEELLIELVQGDMLLLTVYCDELSDETEQHKGKRQTQVQRLVAEHLSRFRRNCWLSGCDIEATADEKAEWVQGFTREEIEAWHLKV